jgi:glycosyltransferase involved in cell wall biosynthesis
MTAAVMSSRIAYFQNSMLETQHTSLISVIMIFLNAEKYIQEAIESVLSQTYPHWELIFVDDGSTDASTEIARQYVQTYPRMMRYVEHEGHQNRGMSASRNLGIRQSRGDYIAFLDADDVYLPHKLERQVALLAAQPTATMVYGTTQYWYSWTGETEDQSRDTMRTLGVRADAIYQPPTLVRGFLRNTARTPATCSVLIRRKAIEEIGGFEESFSGMFEDQVFFYKLCLHETVYVESGCSSRYRQHPESWCHVSLQVGEWKPGHSLSPARAAFLGWIERYVTEEHVMDPQIWHTLRKELWSYRHPKLHFLLATISRLKGILWVRVRRLL